MVDRKRRDELAELLRHFVDGQLTNDEFDERAWEIVDSVARDRERDHVLEAVTSLTWYCYDDLRTHRIKGQWALLPEGNKEKARQIAFLYSDCEYRWPVQNFIPVLELFLMVVTLGLAIPFLRARVRKRRKLEGDWSVWPFFSRKEYEAALAHPRLLAGM